MASHSTTCSIFLTWLRSSWINQGWTTATLASHVAGSLETEVHCGRPWSRKRDSISQRERELEEPREMYAWQGGSVQDKGIPWVYRTEQNDGVQNMLASPALHRPLQSHPSYPVAEVELLQVVVDEVVSKLWHTGDELQEASTRRIRQIRGD